MTNQLALGLVRKERGMAIVETAEAILNNVWLKDAAFWIEVFATAGRPFTAEDVRLRAGDPIYPNSMGAAFNAAARKGIIERAGYTTATRHDRHASMLALWVGK